jgi:hypothetical protein
MAFNKSVRLFGNNRPADVNGSVQVYQAFQFYIFHGPLSYLYQVHVRNNSSGKETKRVPYSACPCMHGSNEALIVLPFFWEEEVKIEAAD